ncbi:hypothetical protein B0T26DRAFT_432216 [Lasiosphaeria miniovina]|uniref:Uncharacterized protein n=1 Tax=Lasiosphaeria miniovina TaxID=1954250 RepID=A0AA40A6G5_9PEZI|nr:uncharacterized protein B0T26DRAFT_432216 [Lasiosphaeria miniovina]KAK0710095.1 hypothetical protein B0T26DRAFT_432216 [Lasiosphaeria miniovina]
MELLRDQESTVFLRNTGDYDLSRLMGILTRDIFPMIEREGLLRFRINCMRSKTWSEDYLVEYYTMVFQYKKDGKCSIGIWRAATDKQHVSTSNLELCKLGDYLSRLPRLRVSPVYFNLAFDATKSTDEPLIGVWKFNRAQFNESNLRLQHQGGFCHEKIAELEVAPLVESDAIEPQQQPDVEASTVPETQPMEQDPYDEPTELDPYEEPLELDPIVETETKGKQEITPKYKTTQAGRSKERSTRDQTARHKKHPATQPSQPKPSTKTSKKKGNKQSERTTEDVQKDVKTDNKDSKKGKGQKRSLAPKRKPKPPLVGLRSGSLPAYHSSH